MVAGAAIVAAFYLSLAKDDPSVLVESQAPTPRIGLADALSTAPHAGPWHLVAGGALWYQSPSGLQRYDLDTHVSETAPGTAVANGIAHSNGIVWAIAEGRNGVVGFDANSGQRVRNIDFEDRTPSDMTWLLATPDKIYVSSFTLDSVFRVDIASGRTDAWRVVAKPKGMVIAGGSLWVPVSREDKILRLNPDTLEVEASIELETTRTHSTCGSCVQGVRASADSIWAVSDDGIAGALLGQVSQVDILSNEVLATHQFAGQISDNFAVDSSGDAWVGFRENGHSDGELVRIDGFTSLIEERIPLAFGTGSLELTTPLGVMVEGDSIIVLTREAKTARVRMAP